VLKLGKVEDFGIDQEMPGVGRRHLRINARRVDTDGSRQGHAVLLSLEDVTEQGKSEFRSTKPAISSKSE